MTRDINIQVAVATEPDAMTVEVRVSAGDEGMRADVTELVLAHLDGLWAQLEVADRIRAVEDRPHRVCTPGRSRRHYREPSNN